MEAITGETGDQFLDDPGVEAAAAFDRFYDGSHRRLLAQLTAMTGDPAEAQDCMQEAYMRAWAHWDRVVDYDSPEAWVRTVAWRVAVGRWRRLRNATSAWLRSARAPALDDVAAVDIGLVRALQQLPKVQRQVIWLYHVADLGVAAIAKETGVPEGTVKARLARGRRRLADLLANGEEDR